MTLPSVRSPDRFQNSLFNHCSPAKNARVALAFFLSVLLTCSEMCLSNWYRSEHCAIKQKVNAKQGLSTLPATRRTVAGHKAMHRMRKEQVR